jgi:DnaJ-class molecular chaperone
MNKTYAYVLNKSKDSIEKATKEKCPRCRGFGAIVTDNSNCHLCNGKGVLYISIEGTGWTKAMYARMDKSKLY